MADVAMETDLLRHFGDLHLTQGAMTQSAGAIDQVATIAAEAPVLGPIATEFLAAHAGAQANLARAVTQLTTVYEGIGAAAHSGAAGYDLVEADSAATFGAQGLAMGSGMPSSAIAAGSSELERLAPELLQVAGEGAGTVGQLVAVGQSVGQQVAASQQAAAAANQQQEARAGSPGTLAPEDAVRRPAMAVAGAAGESPAAPDRSPMAPPDRTQPVTPESDGAEIA